MRNIILFDCNDNQRISDIRELYNVKDSNGQEKYIDNLTFSECMECLYHFVFTFKMKALFIRI
jgi:hypothetical protein